MGTATYGAANPKVLVPAALNIIANIAGEGNGVRWKFAIRDGSWTAHRFVRQPQPHRKSQHANVGYRSSPEPRLMAAAASLARIASSYNRSQAGLTRT
jgi:hypothetical protein